MPDNPTKPRSRVALINPPDPSNPDSGRLLPPLGLGYVGSAARRAGHHVDLFDLALDLRPSVEVLGKRGLFADYQVYGVSTYSDTIGSTMRLCRLIKTVAPKSKLVLGGYHASLVDVDLLKDFAFVDFVVRKEGEEAFCELLDTILDPSRLSESIAGITWRAESGRITRNPDRAALSLAALPFPLHPEGRFAAGEYITFADASGSRVRKTLSIVGSRGCPKRCSFCSIIEMSPLWRARSVADVVSEIAYFRERGEQFEHILFQDANFFVKPSRATEFAKALYAFDQSLTWSATATADKIVRNKGAIAEMARLNCRFIEVGIESGNDNSLKWFNKGPDAALNHEALAILEENGIEIGLDFIMFEPFMSLADLAENLAFLKRNELFGKWPSDFVFQELRLYPGTSAREIVEKRSRTSFGAHEVPDTPFFDPLVSDVFRRLSVFYRTDYRQISRVLKLYSRAIVPLSLSIHAGEGSRLFQRAHQEAIHLRHLPFRVLELLVEDADPSEMRQLVDGALACSTRIEEVGALLNSPDFDAARGRRWAAADIPRIWEADA